MLNTIALYIGYGVVGTFGLMILVYSLIGLRKHIDKKYPSPEYEDEDEDRMCVNGCGKLVIFHEGVSGLEVEVLW